LIGDEARTGGSLERWGKGTDRIFVVSGKKTTAEDRHFPAGTELGTVGP